MLLPNVKFSAKELKSSILYMVLSAFACLILAAITFECEYFSGMWLESLLEMVGVLDVNWMPGHREVFLHIIQVLFVITFVVEIKMLLSKITREWQL